MMKRRIIGRKIAGKNDEKKDNREKTMLVRMMKRRIIGRKNAGKNDEKKDNREKNCW